LFRKGRATVRLRNRSVLLGTAKSNAEMGFPEALAGNSIVEVDLVTQAQKPRGVKLRIRFNICTY
jgi:hypothetical protein